jgi:hypothetical protein
MLQEVAIIGLSMVVLLLGSRIAWPSLSQPDEQTCSQRSTATYHSPKCGWGYVVNDPGRIEDVTIPHDPPYHTYSRWVIRARTYIFAYRDVDNRPDDMRVDIYQGNAGGKVVASIAITGLETHVFSANLTGRDSSDIIFKYMGGELQYLSIVRFADDSIKDVFDCAASTIDILPGPEPKIVARYNVANVVREFVWRGASDKFVKAREFPWHRRP